MGDMPMPKENPLHMVLNEAKHADVNISNNDY
jgi:hypothetical protein